MNLTHTPDQTPAAIARVDAWLRDIATKRAAVQARAEALNAQLGQCDVTEDYLAAEEDRALGRRAELMNQMGAG